MATFDRAVQIGPEFFRKAFSDYNDKHWAFAREILQNSLDCGSSKIDITVVEEPDSDSTLVTVTNNGEPMTEEVLTGKLLSLGSSGKDFRANKVGGFGKAKEILYFAHREYEVRSGDHVVSGSGASYRLGTGPRLKGTRSTVRWAGPHGGYLIDEFKRVIQLCGFAGRCKFTLNGEPVKPTLRVGDVERELKGDDGVAWAEVRLARQDPGTLVVRIGGVPMYRTWCKFRGSVVVELLGTSEGKLTSNRDALKYPYSERLTELVVQLAVDTASAFKLEKPVYTRFSGPVVRINRPRLAPVEPKQFAEAAVAAWVQAPDPQPAGIRALPQGRLEAPQGLMGHQFILKNCVRRAVPAEFNPESLKFSDHAHWLVRAYTGCLVELYALHEIREATFSVGFLFSEDTLAEIEESAEYGLVYFLNPCLTTRKRSTRRYKKSNRHQIVALAAHEFIHGGRGRGWHDEQFASILTDVMALVLRNYTKFTRHLK